MLKFIKFHNHNNLSNIYRVYFCEMHTFAIPKRDFKSSSFNGINFKIVRSDLDINLDFLKNIKTYSYELVRNSNENKIPNLEEIFFNIKHHIFQFEFQREKKLNNFFHALLEIITNSSVIQKQILGRNKNLKDILMNLLSVENLRILDTKSIISILILINLKIIDSEEIKFLIQSGISEESYILKILKYGRSLLKLNMNENFIRQLFIKVSQVDNTKFLSKISIDDNLLEYIIFAKYLDKNRKDDYYRYIERCILKLEKEIESDVAISKEDVHKRLLVLKSSIDNLNFKKENPNLKIISDILLAFIREYKKFLDSDHLIFFYSILSSDKFLTQYDINLFKEKFEEELLALIDSENFPNKENYLISMLELFYYVDRLYSFDDFYFQKFSEKILAKTKKICLLEKASCLFNDEEILHLLELYISDSANYFNTFNLNFSEFSSTKDLKGFLKKLNSYNEHDDCLIARIKRILKFKVFFKLEKKFKKENSLFIRNIKEMIENQELISLTKNCLELYYFIENNLTSN